MVNILDSLISIIYSFKQQNQQTLKNIFENSYKKLYTVLTQNPGKDISNS